MQQIGFAFPGVYSVIIIFSLNIKGDDVPEKNVNLFYFITAAFVFPGLFAWVSYY
jgi:hypothetical protein